jgi:hypothetical protein
MQFEVDGTHLAETCEVYIESATCIQSKYNIFCQKVFPSLSLSPEFVSSAPTSDSEAVKALKHLRPFKPVGFVDITGLVTKGCYDIFVSLLKYFQSKFISAILSHLMEARGNCSCFPKKGTSASISNYRPTCILNIFSNYVDDPSGAQIMDRHINITGYTKRLKIHFSY